MSYAICTIIFGNSSYLVGGCLSFYTHRQFIEKNNLNIKLVVLVDEHIYKYKSILNIYFDQVIKINLDTIKLNYTKIEDKGSLFKYSKWIKYSINKWQIFNLDNYDKVLFVDVDVLPISAKFYDVFNNITPSVLVNKIYENNVKIDKSFFTNKKFFTDKDFNTDKFLTNSINATMILVHPDKKIYKEYLNFVKICEGTNGYISSHADETSLLYFLGFYKNMDLYSISKYYASLLKEYDEEKTVGLDYPSTIKPWERVPMLQWAEENIWHQIAKKALPKSTDLTEMYVGILLERLIAFSNNYEKIKHFNKECISEDKIFNLSKKIFELLKDKKINQIESSGIKNIFKLAEQVHGMMNKKSKTNLKNIIEIIN